MLINNLASFEGALDSLGFEEFWRQFIISYTAALRPDIATSEKDVLKIDLSSPLFTTDNIGELYEISLERTNQISKKEFGQYYTPKDTADFMARKLVALFDEAADTLADVCTGTGNLIVEVLFHLQPDTVVHLLQNGRVYLYDLDKTALALAVMKIAILFVPQDDKALFKKIRENSGAHQVSGNFLDEAVALPDNAVVISNPPYGRMPLSIEGWEESRTAVTKEMYAVFMEKIATQAKAAVVISPQSFLGSDKFTSLRLVLGAYGGTIYSFDNVPAPMFSGRKKGIFNTNTANSVRAAITIVDKTQQGFLVSPMLRFRTHERALLFSVLDSVLGKTRYHSRSPWRKTPKNLERLSDKLREVPHRLGDCIETSVYKQEERWRLIVPTTPRYFVTASTRDLDRSSKAELFAKNEECFVHLYTILNSSISYFWWRMHDGGITLARSTLLDIPMPAIDVEAAKQVVEKGIQSEDQHLMNKMNAGRNNENIKFPLNYRRQLNEIVLKSLDETDIDGLMSIHANSLEDVLPYWQHD